MYGKIELLISAQKAFENYFNCNKVDQEYAKNISNLLLSDNLTIDEKDKVLDFINKYIPVETKVTSFLDKKSFNRIKPYKLTPLKTINRIQNMPIKLHSKTLCLSINHTGSFKN